MKMNSALYDILTWFPFAFVIVVSLILGEWNQYVERRLGQLAKLNSSASSPASAGQEIVSRH
jgi:hypothetical protein